MPSIMEGSILIMSKAGIGTAMFNMGKITNLLPLLILFYVASFFLLQKIYEKLNV